MDKPTPTGTVRSGPIELIQKGTKIIVRYTGKRQVVETEIEASTLERWAIRQLKNGVFA